MKKSLFLLSALIVLLVFLSGCTLINGIFLSSDAKELVGLWQSEGWDDEDHNCFWDFRADGRVYVTEWTDNLETKLIPTHFNYSVKDGMLTLTQYFGIARFVFEITDESNISDDSCYLRVDDYTSDFDYYRMDYSTTFSLTRRSEYSSESIFVRSFYEEAHYE